MTGPGKEAAIRPLKIAHCLPDQGWVDEMRGQNPRDAAHIQQKYIAEGLRAHGHTITFVAPFGLDQVIVTHERGESLPVPQTWAANEWFKLAEKLTWKLQQLFRIPYLNYFSNLHRFNACLNCLPGHDVVFERNSLYNSGAAMACKKLHIPYVMFFDADQIAELDFMGKPLIGLLRWRAKRLLRYNLDAAHCIICVSKSAKKHLMENWNVSSGKLVVMSNAVDVRRFKPNLNMRAETRASLHLAMNPLVVFVGSFYQWHDVRTLLTAFAAVLNTYPDARLILVGDGNEREKMVILARDLGVEHSVIFTGFVSHADVARIVNAADIAVVPVPQMQVNMWLSPMKLFEYMASGKAVVASAMGQIKEVVKDGKNGLLVPAGDEIALEKAITRLIEDESFREHLGRQAREDAIKDHSWSQYLVRLENVFADSMARVVK